MHSRLKIPGFGLFGLNWVFITSNNSFCNQNLLLENDCLMINNWSKYGNKSDIITLKNPIYVNF